MELIKFILAKRAGVHLSRRQIKLINGMESMAQQPPIHFINSNQQTKSN